MEWNGVQYEGVLFANRVKSTSPSTSSSPCTPNKITPPTTTSSSASANSPVVEDRSSRVVTTVPRPLVSS